MIGIARVWIHMCLLHFTGYMSIIHAVRVSSKTKPKHTLVNKLLL